MPVPWPVHWRDHAACCQPASQQWLAACCLAAGWLAAQAGWLAGWWLLASRRDGATSQPLRQHTLSKPGCAILARFHASFAVFSSRSRVVRAEDARECTLRRRAQQCIAASLPSFVRCRSDLTASCRSQAGKRRKSFLSMYPSHLLMSARLSWPARGFAGLLLSH